MSEAESCGIHFIDENRIKNVPAGARSNEAVRTAGELMQGGTHGGRRRAAVEQLVPARQGARRHEARQHHGTGPNYARYALQEVQLY